jgi:hypothetical protein
MTASPEPPYRVLLADQRPFVFIVRFPYTLHLHVPEPRVPAESKYLTVSWHVDLPFETSFIGRRTINALGMPSISVS